MLAIDLQHVLKGKHEAGDLSDYFKVGSPEPKAKLQKLLNPQTMSHVRSVRYHELQGKIPISPGVLSTGFWLNQAWHIDLDQVPYKFHLVRWNVELWELATGYEVALDMLDILKDVLAYLPAMRSVVIRELIGDVPDLTEEQQRELDEYARAAGM